MEAGAREVGRGIVRAAGRDYRGADNDGTSRPDGRDAGNAMQAEAERLAAQCRGDVRQFVATIAGLTGEWLEAVMAAAQRLYGNGFVAAADQARQVGGEVTVGEDGVTTRSTSTAGGNTIGGRTEATTTVGKDGYDNAQRVEVHVGGGRVGHDGSTHVGADGVSMRNTFAVGGKQVTFGGSLDGNTLGDGVAAGQAEAGRFAAARATTSGKLAFVIQRAGQLADAGFPALSNALKRYYDICLRTIETVAAAHGSSGGSSLPIVEESLLILARFDEITDAMCGVADAAIRRGARAVEAALASAIEVGRRADELQGKTAAFVEHNRPKLDRAADAAEWEQIGSLAQLLTTVLGVTRDVLVVVEACCAAAPLGPVASSLRAAATVVGDAMTEAQAAAALVSAQAASAAAAALSAAGGAAGTVTDALGEDADQAGDAVNDGADAAGDVWRNTFG